MAAAYRAAPAQAPRPMPTDDDLTDCELPESPPIGAPAPCLPDDVAWGLYVAEVSVPSSIFAPGRIGMAGLIISINAWTDWSGLLYAFDLAV